jgi:hypothetical protein
MNLAPAGFEVGSKGLLGSKLQLLTYATPFSRKSDDARL